MKKICLKVLIIIMLIIFYIYTFSIMAIPNNIYIFNGQKINYKIPKGISLKFNDDTTILTANNYSKKIIEENRFKKMNISLFKDIKIKDVNVNIIPKTKVIPIGRTIGIKLYTKGVLVVGMSNIKNEKNEKIRPYEKTGIEEGDIIISINDKNIANTEELINEINKSQGKALKVKYLKENKYMETNILPIKNEKEYKIGLWVRDTAAGVGTLTFYEPSTNSFMALGHGIVDIDTGKIISISKGELITANIISIKKGRKGEPGELKGTIDNGNKIGEIEKNTKLGIYGKVNNKNNLEITKEAMEVADRSEIKEGKAKVICQLDNTISQMYDIEIEKIYLNNNEDNKSMLIKINDPQLLEKTGGIIQGMSGAPIIQNGKFIGAITNVLVNNPRQGYAIFADMMIKQMRKVD